MWEYMPVIVLERIYSMLTLAERYACSLVCRHWLSVFRSGHIWRHLVIGERTFTRRKWRSTALPSLGAVEYEIRHWSFQMYLGQFGHHCRRLTFQPIATFYNLFEFLRIISCYLEFFDEYPMPNLDEFEFTFCCETRYSASDTLIHGTGGQILAELLRVIGNLRDLTSLTVNHLLLDVADGMNLLDAVFRKNFATLRSLELLNITRVPSPACLPMLERFPNLVRLAVSPSQLSDDILVNISQDCLCLEELAIVEDRYTLFTYQLNEAPMIYAETWRQVRAALPYLKVRLEYRGPPDLDLTLVDGEAPVDTIAYVTPWSLVHWTVTSRIADRYAKTLTTYGHAGVSRRHRSRSFDDRADLALVDLVRRCRRLKKLVVRERVSTATLIVLAAEGQALEELVVRRNAVVQKSDWPKQIHWSTDFYSRLRAAARSYDETEREISRLLARPWTMLSDRAFKCIRF